MKASEFLPPELVSTDTDDDNDDDDLTAAGSEYESSRMHATTATPTFPHRASKPGGVGQDHV